LARATATKLIVELPGLRDAQGRPPFWEGLGRHFYAGDPTAAAARHGALWRTYVAALLPRETLLVSFLSDSAQAAIGAAAATPEVQALLAALQSLGFRRSDYVAIDDAGPVLVAEAGASITA
jgi:arginine N-succinyltransferase